MKYLGSLTSIFQSLVHPYHTVNLHQHLSTYHGSYACTILDNLRNPHALNSRNASQTPYDPNQILLADTDTKSKSFLTNTTNYENI